jgi:TRAP-type C4-dicarboxylate transport system substrate-binding protein
MADIKGMKFRVSPSYEAFVKALGAVPIYMEPGEIYSAVSQGVVDGFGYPDCGLTAFKGIIKHRIVHKFYTNESTMLANLDTWNGIPKDMQKLVISVVEEIEREVVPYREKEVEAELREHMALGMKLIEFPPDEAKAYVDLAYKAAWEEAKKEIDPDLYLRARKLYGLE